MAMRIGNTQSGGRQARQAKLSEQSAAPVYISAKSRIMILWMKMRWPRQRPRPKPLSGKKPCRMPSIRLNLRR